MRERLATLEMENSQYRGTIAIERRAVTYNRNRAEQAELMLKRVQAVGDREFNDQYMRCMARLGSAWGRQVADEIVRQGLDSVQLASVDDGPLGPWGGEMEAKVMRFYIRIPELAHAFQAVIKGRERV